MDVVRYPYRDPYLATAASAILDANGQIPRPRRLAVHVPGLAGRNELPTLEGRGSLSVALYRQSHPAPLLFILAGIGSNAYFGLGTYFAWLFHQQGFHVVIVPSPMSWNFALAASRSGAPGFVPDDARDLYDAMQRTLTVLEASYRVKPTRIALMGASLGALEGAYLSVLDADERKIGIDTYLLVNPPLDLNYALKTVDDWNALSAKFGREGTRRLVGRGLALIDAFSSRSPTMKAVVRFTGERLGEPRGRSSRRGTPASRRASGPRLGSEYRRGPGSPAAQTGRIRCVSRSGSRSSRGLSGWIQALMYQGTLMRTMRSLPFNRMNHFRISARLLCRG